MLNLQHMFRMSTLSRNAHPTVKLYLDQVGFDVLTAVSTKMAVFWVVAACSLIEIGKLLPDYTALKPRIQPSLYLDHLFPARWIGRTYPQHWPPISPDLNSCIFICTGTWKIWCTSCARNGNLEVPTYFMAKIGHIVIYQTTISVFETCGPKLNK
jgi:hypothetical protein